MLNQFKFTNDKWNWTLVAYSETEEEAVQVEIRKNTSSLRVITIPYPCMGMSVDTYKGHHLNSGEEASMMSQMFGHHPYLVDL